MNMKYRNALIRSANQAATKAEYRKFSSERFAGQVKAMKTMFLGMLPALLVLLTVICFVFFLSNQGIAP